MCGSDRKHQAVSSTIIGLGVIQALIVIDLVKELFKNRADTCFEVVFVRWFLVAQLGVFSTLVLLVICFRTCGVFIEYDPLPIRKLRKQQDDAETCLGVHDMREFERKNNLTSDGRVSLR